MWLSQIESLISKQTLVWSNRRFCISPVQSDSRKSPERNDRTRKRQVVHMESPGIGIVSPYLRDPIFITPPPRSNILFLDLI